MAPEHVVVVGASLAGLRAIETARRLGFDGRLTLIGAESHLPYDRPPLSKHFISDGPPAQVPHFPGVHELADDLGVDVRLGHPATGLDVDGHTVQVDGEPLEYDALLVATGAHARRLPGTDHLSGVHTLRTVDDAVEVRAALNAEWVKMFPDADARPARHTLTLPPDSRAQVQADFTAVIT